MRKEETYDCFWEAERRFSSSVIALKFLLKHKIVDMTHFPAFIKHTESSVVKALHTRWRISGPICWAQQEAWMSHWGTTSEEYQSVLSSVALRGEADVCCPTDSLFAESEHKPSVPLKITLDSARNTHRILHNNTKHQQREREREERGGERERGERERREREREGLLSTRSRKRCTTNQKEKGKTSECHTEKNKVQHSIKPMKHLQLY